MGLKAKCKKPVHPAHTPCKHPQERAGCTECLHLAFRPLSYKSRYFVFSTVSLVDFDVP